MSIPYLRRLVALISLWGLLALASSGCGNSAESPADTCGNGELDEGEVCDANDLGAQTCETLGASPGQLACNSTCLGFDLSGCTAPWTCADGIIQAPEVCDGEGLGGADCASLGFDKGTLGCANSCLEFDTAACVSDGECAPKTCATEGAQCGAIDDGCGGTLDCGECAGDLSCGGGGEANRCGASCAKECPDGFSCNALGECAGNADPIVVNMPTATVEVVAKLNGQMLQPTPDCVSTSDHDGLASISLSNLESDLSYIALIPCNGSSVSLTVPHGTYQVKIRGRTPDMPSFDYLAYDAMVIDSDKTITADMLTATVQFVAKLNGQTPDCDDATNYQLTRITLTHLASKSISYNHTLGCDGSSPSALIPHGTYEVSVWGHGPDTRPGELYPFYAHDSLVIDTDTTITTDTQVARVQLVAQFNGETPQALPDCEGTWYSRRLATIQLTNLTSRVHDSLGTVSSYGIPCDGRSLSVLIPHGTYKVTILGENTYMPMELYEAYPAMVIDSDKTITANMQATTVELIAKLNGRLPIPTLNCPLQAPTNRRLAVIKLTNLATGKSKTKTIPCHGSPQKLTVTHGTYQVQLWGLDSDMPGNHYQAFSYVTHDALVIDGEQTIVADMPITTVHLVARVNGQMPEATSACKNEGFIYKYYPFRNPYYYNYNAFAQITLTDLRHRTSHIHDLPCNGAPLSVSIPHGLYEVSVRGFASNMLNFSYRTHDMVVINSEQTIVADMPTSTVNWVAKFNGQTPQATPECTEPNSSSWLANISLKNMATEIFTDYSVPCNGDPVNTTIPQGTYEVSVRGRASDMPSSRYIAIPKIKID